MLPLMFTLALSTQSTPEATILVEVNSIPATQTQSKIERAESLQVSPRRSETKATMAADGSIRIECETRDNDHSLDPSLEPQK